MYLSDTRRLAGVLLHPTSLPGGFGIGDFGLEARKFIDFLSASNQHLWQVLPLNPIGPGNSPYQCFSAFAGETLLISPEELVDIGLLTRQDLPSSFDKNYARVHYKEVTVLKEKLFQKAYQNFSLKEPTKEYHTFLSQESFWLNDFALFRSIQKKTGQENWLKWKREYRFPSREERTSLYSLFQQEMNYEIFLQFLFFSQWNSLKEYARQKGVYMIGDLPIFLSILSADVWANPHLFQLDEDGYPAKVAGVPPDYFCEDGQLWGNPLYDWQMHQKEDFSWWIARMKMQLSMYDLIRLDHFRGYESYWAVDSKEKTAKNGTWEKAPGFQLFTALTQACGAPLPIIAEDLGIITPEVVKLRNAFHFPGMKVLQFAFMDTADNDLLPHRFDSSNYVCYTGTHDNDTTKGWYRGLEADAKKKVCAYVNSSGSNISQGLIRCCYASIAKYAVLPIQDILSLGSRARMNVPGTPRGNWEFRLTISSYDDTIIEELKFLTTLYGRE